MNEPISLRAMSAANVTTNMTETQQRLAQCLARQRQAYGEHPVPELPERKQDLCTLQRFIRDLPTACWSF